MALLIEGLVAALLAVTIGYCVVLNRRLKSLRTDEAALRHTVGELIAASETAAQAVAGLRQTVAAEEAALAKRLGEARLMARRIDEAVADGEDLMRTLRLVAQANPGAEPVRPAANAVATVAADAAARLAELRRRNAASAAA